jgi:hypothetical protein
MEIFTMKKTLIALALASAMGTAAADVTINGSVQRELTMQDGVNDITSSPAGNWLSFTAKEDLGNGAYAAVKQQLKLDNEDGDGVSVYDSWVALGNANGEVKVGRMKSFSMNAGDAYIDLFEGSSQDVTFASRDSNRIQVTANVAGVTIGAAMKQDGAAGEDKADVVEYMANGAFGPVKAGVVYRDDQTNDNQYTVVGAATSVSDLSLSGAFETVANNDGTPDVDTYSVVAGYSLGNNGVMVGYQDSDEAESLKTYEVTHNFSKSTVVYANLQQQSGVEDVIGVGLHYKF